MTVAVQIARKVEQVYAEDMLMDVLRERLRRSPAYRRATVAWRLWLEHEWAGVLAQKL